MSNQAPWRVRWNTRLRYWRASGRLRRIALYSITGLIGLGAIWIVATGVLAHREAQRVENELHQVEALVAEGRIAEAQHVSADIPTRAGHAHTLTTGPAWWLAAHVPYFGEPVEIVRGATAAANEIGAHGIPDLLEVASSLDPDSLRTSGTSLNLAPLIAAAPKLAAAANTLDAAINTVNRLPHSSWLSAVNGPRQRLAAELTSIGGYVDAAARASRILPTMLGAHGPQRYFIGLQNEAEMRGTGGLPGAFAIAVADKGTVTFTHFESDAALLPAATGQLVPTGLNFGTDYTDAYGASEPTSFIVNSNLSPNFPYAAQIWASMWEKVSGEHIDGAIALDPAVLASFLTITGPVGLPDGAVVSSDNVVSLTERDEYAIFNDNNERKAFVVSILKSVSTRLINQKAGAIQLARAISSAAQDQRLMVWSSIPAAEDVLQQTSYAGAIPDTPATFAGLVLNNIAAGKLDFYLVRTMTYHRSGCGDTRNVIVTITLTNEAPATGLPAYVDTRLDKHTFPVNPGDNRTLMDYYATAGSQLLSVTLNDKLTTIAVKQENGHPIFRMDLELPRGTTQTVVLNLTEPKTSGAPIVWRQPGVTPIATSFYAQPCG